MARRSGGDLDDVLDQFRVLGMDNAQEDFEEDDDLEDEIELADLVRQYKDMLAARRGGGQRADADQGATEIAKAAVKRYVEKADRSGHDPDTALPPARRVFDDEYDDTVGADQPRAYEEWREGYIEELEKIIATAIIDAYAEDASERPAATSQRRARGNPAGDRPSGIGVWYKDGQWDASHAFDPDTLEHYDIEMDGRKVIDGRGQVSDELAKAEGARMGDELKKAMLADDDNSSWIDQNHDTVEEYGHDPVEAYKQWVAGYADYAKGAIARWLLDEGQRYLDDHEDYKPRFRPVKRAAR